MNNKKVVLEIENLKKYFINKNHINRAVDGVSFKVHEGEVVGLIGESGSGKTTVGRSLLRLYDDFNGYVSLDDKIISGKKISRKRTKMMRKNIQMIFQDPHASLNGQKTIFSILKEPLIVNGIINDEIKDLSKDWNSIKDNFHYSFLERTRNLVLKSYQLANAKLVPFHQVWNEKLNNYKYDSNLSAEDNFNNLFSFIEERNKINSIIITNLHKVNDELLLIYNQKKENFRNNELDFDEVDLQNAKNAYNEAYVLSKISEEELNTKKTIKELKNQLKELRNEQYEIMSIAQNSFNNFLDELSNEAKFQSNNSNYTFDKEFYIHSVKLSEINKVIRKILKSKISSKFNLFSNTPLCPIYRLKNNIKSSNCKNIKNTLYYLSINETREMFKEINEKIKNIYDEISKDEKLSNLAKSNKVFTNAFKLNLSKFIVSSSHLNLDKWISISKERALDFNNKINNLNHKIIQLENDLTKIAGKAKAKYSSEDLIVYQKNLDKAEAIHQDELKKYIHEFNLRLDKINKEISVGKEKYLSLKVEYKNQLKLFEKAFDSFVHNFKQQIKSQANSKKEVKKLVVELNVYKATVSKRLEGLKAYDIEMKYLDKDLFNIYKLLGIHDLDNKFNNISVVFFRKIASKIKDYFFKKDIKKLFIKEKIYKSLESVGLLKQFAYRYPHEFSGGQRQRIVIARALITEPKVIIADEPIASLDISIQAQVVNLLKDLCKNKNIAMIFIAHDLSMIEYVADNVQIMHLGKIVESGKTEKIYENPIHPYTNNLFKAIPKISNANEKFQNISFELKYLEEQQFPNIPTLHKVEDQHYIYSTDQQFEKWINEEHYKASTLK
ncbi:ATP-binding cassette domain-containing protein [Mycoplasmopsis anatis]|uniref:Oligopeptide ABC transporter, ATP-binding protein OppF n=1 Tax=Mycoplasmopsis anatis 1340 TaxID=1034808 RepID=F9QEL9_9BACT|nr:ATP-binding cassette domain-containing protein [Mycoplasmopsis anatis]AWX69818.1 ATP-binding cassette domain-containing protein [Mycoplasmopsis anatis]EGS28809.1 oligopeptide ABC transporter, ATP-binding protein OppF [Mycoplasmopsis anatis 1340]VEU73763.1 phosphate ABC transporter ATP-binding protein [Mycoplasmopsis anatis]